MAGPYFDLEAIWEEHTYLEFEVRDVEATMATMVQEPYVNHIPTVSKDHQRSPHAGLPSALYMLSMPFTVFHCISLL